MPLVKSKPLKSVKPPQPEPDPEIAALKAKSKKIASKATAEAPRKRERIAVPPGLVTRHTTRFPVLEAQALAAAVTTTGVETSVFIRLAVSDKIAGLHKKAEKLAAKEAKK